MQGSWAVGNATNHPWLILTLILQVGLRNKWGKAGLPSYYPLTSMAGGNSSYHQLRLLFTEIAGFPFVPQEKQMDSQTLGKVTVTQDG